MSIEPNMAPELSFESAVEQSLEVVAEAIRDEWRGIDRLNDLPDAVFLKNAEAVLIHVNDAFSQFFSPHVSPVGRNGASFLESSIAYLSEHSDGMIAGGTSSIDIRYIGRGPDGRAYRIRTHKESLSRFGNPGIALLGVTRVEGVVPEAEALPKLDISDKSRRFRALDEIDRDIAKQIGHGKKVREIADELQLTTRAVEQRKRKILSKLELEQTLDLVKLLVRMQDHGFLDLGL